MALRQRLASKAAKVVARVGLAEAPAAPAAARGVARVDRGVARAGSSCAGRNQCSRCHSRNSWSRSRCHRRLRCRRRRKSHRCWIRTSHRIPQVGGARAVVRVAVATAGVPTGAGSPAGHSPRSRCQTRNTRSRSRALRVFAQEHKGSSRHRRRCCRGRMCSHSSTTLGG